MRTQVISAHELKKQPVELPTCLCAALGFIAGVWLHPLLLLFLPVSFWHLPEEPGATLSWHRLRHRLWFILAAFLGCSHGELVLLDVS